jgi:acetyltransferase-like isoleucine patch superfamily enzyme
MFKKIIKNILYEIFLKGKIQYEIREKKIRYAELSQRAIIGENTIISDQALIHNSTGNNNKIKIGQNCLINGYLLVFNHGGELSIGNDCFIGKDTRIWSAKKIAIGNRVLISHNVNIHDNNSHPINPKERHEDFVHIFNQGLRPENNLNEKTIIIEDDVWIGFNSTILKGVTIGKAAIIGACSVITEDVPPGAIVVGNPSRIIKYID